MNLWLNRNIDIIKLLHFLFLILVAVNSQACAQDQSAELSTADRQQQVENGLLPPYFIEGSEPERYTIGERMEYYNVPGMSIAVINNGEVEWRGAYGLVESGSETTVTDSTLFQAASISKPVAAIAALKLVEEGILEFDDDVNDYLTTWKIPDNRNTRNNHVSVRTLLNHTSGLTVHGFPGYSQDEILPTVSEILDGRFPANTSSVYTDVEPGEMWRYSGGGYTVLQQLIDDVTGESFSHFVQQHVLDELDMQSSTFEQPLSEINAARTASGHLDDGSVVEGKWHIYPELAAAGLWTTPSDLARLAITIQEIINGSSSGLLSAEMTRTMLTPGENDWGLGFRIGGSKRDPFFSHGGANHGYRAQFIAYANSGKGVVIMTNSDNGGELINEVLRAVADVYDWPDFQPQKLIIE